ncbi:MAG: LysM peptidoglycan-binding domain-containing protein [Verrucomicrobiota bacterium]
MNTQNSFPPQGMQDDQKPKSRSNVYIAVFAILAFHVVLLGALLVQGCKDKQTVAKAPPLDNSSLLVGNSNSTPLDMPLTTTPSVVTPPMQPPQSVVVNPPATPVVPVTPLPPVDSGLTPPAVATGTATEHPIAKGDSFTTIAKKYGVSVAAITKANPGVDSRKLKIGLKIKIPEKTAAVATAKPVDSVAPAATTDSSGNVYTVKKNDSLIKIAKAKGTTPKQIKMANNLPTDMIREGQKLKIPGKAEATVPAAPAAPAAMPVTPPSVTS